MVSYKLQQSDRLYQKLFHGVDITHFDVYAPSQERLGSVIEVVFDRENHQCYLNLDSSTQTGTPLHLLPLNRFRLDEARRRVYVEQVSGAANQSIASQPIAQPVSEPASVRRDRPSFTDSRQNHVPVEAVSPVEVSAPLDSEIPLEAPIVMVPGHYTTHYINEERRPAAQPAADVAFKRAVPETPELRPSAAPLGAETEATIQLLEERVVPNRQRRKVGEVIIRKETETHMVQVPVRREKLVVEQVGETNRQLASIYLNGQQDRVSTSASTEAPLSSRQVMGRANHARISAEFSSVQEAIQFLQQQSHQFGNAEVQITLRRDRGMESGLS